MVSPGPARSFMARMHHPARLYLWGISGKEYGPRRERAGRDTRDCYIGSSGDHAGSDASIGVMTSRRLRPVISTL